MSVRMNAFAKGRYVLAAVVVLASGCGSSGSAQGNAASGLVARDQARSAGLFDHTMTHGDDCVGDINGDGHLDVLLNSHTDRWNLFYGSATGRFTLATSFSLRDRHSCVFADFNGDGRLDIYFAIGDCRGQRCLNKKELLIQRPDHTFVDEAKQWGVTDAQGRGRTAMVVNANGDGRPDLFTGEDVGVAFPGSNKLWINEGNHFVLHSGPPTLGLGELDNCPVTGDITHDGLDDIGVCTPAKGFHLYRALGNGNYADDNEAFGLPPWGRRDVRLVDVNHDGWVDFISVSQTRVTVQLNEHGRFAKPVFSLTTKDAADANLGDVDGDGNLDLYVAMRGTEQDKLFLGDGTGHFVAGPPLPLKHGSGESVTVLPRWNNGRDAFIVNNGYETTRGDLQLIAVYGTRTKK
jgi:hypothetical protein